MDITLKLRALFGAAPGRAQVLTRVGLACCAGVILANTAGCIVVPAERHSYGGGPIVYVEPTYPSPGVGWVWDYHPRYGYGWRHPDHGWHRGWR